MSVFNFCVNIQYACWKQWTRDNNKVFEIFGEWIREMCDMCVGVCAACSQPHNGQMRRVWVCLCVVCVCVCGLQCQSCSITVCLSVCLFVSKQETWHYLLSYISFTCQKNQRACTAVRDKLSCFVWLYSSLPSLRLLYRLCHVRWYSVSLFWFLFSLFN